MAIIQDRENRIAVLCSRCARPVDSVEVYKDAAEQALRVAWLCHGESGEQKITHEELEDWDRQGLKVLRVSKELTASQKRTAKRVME